MELIHIANATFSSLSFKTKHSLENLASKQKLSGLLKSRRCAWQRRLTTRQVARSRQHMLEPLRQRPVQAMATTVRHELASSRASRSGGRGAGGASRDRTGDLLVANQALSQLSYGPLVGLGGVAPPTSPLSGVRSN